MTSAGRIKLRLWVYVVVLAYLLCDFVIFRGPLYHAARGVVAPAGDVVARVNGRELALGQVERATLEMLRNQGRKPGELGDFERKTARLAALDGLIDRELLRASGESLREDFPVDAAEVDARIRVLSKRFDTRATMKRAALEAGVGGEGDLRYRVTSWIRQEKIVAARTEAASAVTEEEAARWFAGNKKSLGFPERAEVRHVFLATLGKNEDEVKTSIEAALADLTGAKKTFPDIAKEMSDDPASRFNGGYLGWISRDRLIPDFYEAVSAMPVKKPGIVRSRLGWHLVEVLDRKPAEERTWEEAKPEVMAALQAVKRKQAIAEFRKALRRENEAGIEILADKIGGQPFAGG